jgi:hypothetical protein
MRFGWRRRETAAPILGVTARSVVLLSDGTSYSVMTVSWAIPVLTSLNRVACRPIPHTCVRIASLKIYIHLHTDLYMCVACSNTHDSIIEIAIAKII